MAHPSGEPRRGDPRLVRAYRRLLRAAYPPGPRRDELLDTLVETAPPGRRRPAVREVVNLLRHGGRARLGRPWSRGVVVLAVFVALAGGLLGAAGVSRLGWQAVGPLPAGAEAAGISGTVFPGLAVWGGGDAEKIVSQSDGEGLEYGYAVSWVRHTAATRDVAGYAAGVRARLEAAGWTVTGVDPPLDRTGVVGAQPGDAAAGFTARRGELGLRFSGTYWPGRPAYDGDGRAMYYLWQEPPSWLAAVTWLGFLPGALLAWLLTGWVSRSLQARPGLSLLAAGGAVLGVLFVVPAGLPAATPGGPADETAAPGADGLGYALATPAATAGVVAALLVLAAAARRPPRAPAWAGRWRRAVAGRPRAAVALGGVAVAVLGAGVVGVMGLHVVPGSCTPSAPAGVADPPSARLSYRARVFLDPQATDDQRNLAEAAIWRGMGGSQSFAGDSRSADFLAAYCRRGRPDARVADALPRHWTVDLASPGLFAGLAAELMATPGVVAVQHVPR